ncbi:hypothetical protein WQ54_29305 [Bacillus sp. SA1-12]|uniref:hypothetical protein n=1 Tax=Bacillus sp. SA1-12 TaxID=1455638 RepID=UPI000627254D|nr:hypothetical protein [Bacillus sp. SA1-12]KKI88860.1 hypothetical protein WQ54_29305 [Bacillus sp. SA1-12]
MKKNKIYIVLMTILPWLSVPLLGVKTCKRFLPGALFMCLYLIIEGSIAEKRKWWYFPTKVKPNVLAEFPLIFGPFLVGALWITKYTFGKFYLYVILNIVVDSFFTYFVINWFKKIGYVTLVRLSRLQLSILFLVKSFVMYGFQYLYEKYLTRHQSHQ